MNERYIEEAVTVNRFSNVLPLSVGNPTTRHACLRWLLLRFVGMIPVLGGESYLGTRCGLPPLHELIGAIVIRRQGAVNSKNRF